MRGFLLLFRRDLQQRWMLFVASFAMGLFILGLPFVTGSRLPPAELRAAAGLTAALTWAAVLALLLGGSIFTRDLTENRLAFDFRLPVRPSAIWAARLLAAIATIALAEGLVLAPSAAVGMDWTGASAGLDLLVGSGATNALTYSPVAILAILLLAIPVALVARTRSAWAGVDAFSLVLVATVVYSSWHALRLWQAQTAIWQMILVLIGVTLLGTAISSLIQLVRGRTEAQKAQRFLSLGLLSTAIIGSTTVLGLSQWTLRPKVDDLIGNASGAQSLNPDWVALIGPTRRAALVQSRFLLAPTSGRLLRLGPLSGDPGDRKSVSGSIDGSTIAWLESDGESSKTLRFFRLSTKAATTVPESTPTLTSARCMTWALSPDGGLVAALEMLGDASDPMRLVVSLLATGDVVAAVQFPHCRVSGDMLFPSSKELLIPCGYRGHWDTKRDEVRLVRVDLVSKTAQSEPYSPVFPPAVESSLGLVQSARGWLRLLTAKTDDLQTAWELRDYETDRFVANLAPAALVRSSQWLRGRQLRDGTFAMAISLGESHLATYSAEGTPILTVPLPLGVSTILAESADSKTVLVSTYYDPPRGTSLFSFAEIDLRKGTMRPLGKGLQLSGWLFDISAEHSVFRDRSGRLLWFNPATKVLQPLLGEAQYFDAGLPSANHY